MHDLITCIQNQQKVSMKIPSEINDVSFLNMVMEQLGAISARNGHKYNSAEEMLGAVSKGLFKLTHAVNEGNGKVTAMVLSELANITAITMKSSRLYMHNSTPMANIHGLDDEGQYHEQH